jgi:hypothetical protein
MTAKRIVVGITDWRNWARGLVGAIIGGGANAVTAMVVEPKSFNFAEGWTSLWHFTLVSAIVSAALYLKQKPIPEGHEVDDSSNETSTP